jgi:protein SCO1/2
VTAPLLAALLAAFPIKPPTPPPQVGAVDVVERLGERIPTDLRFVDSSQRTVALGDLLGRGKPVVLSLVYFDCPMLCSLVQKGLVKGLNESDLVLGKDYLATTVSFSPRDTPRKAAEAQRGYLQMLTRREEPDSAATGGAPSAKPSPAANWPFLTGGDAEIRSLADGLGFLYRWDEQTRQYEHPAVSMVLTPDGRIARYLYGIEYTARDLRLSVVEASQGRVGTTLDRVLLKCFRYDPVSRRYRLVAVNFVRAGAFCVFLALATGLAVLWRAEAKRRNAS